MKRLTPQDGDVLAQYGHAYDGLIRSIRIDFPARAEPISAEVVLLVRKAGMGPRWVHLHFRFDAISEFRFSEGTITYRVLGDGARITWKDSQVKLDMDPGPDGIDHPIVGRQSGFFVIGSDCVFEETPYSEEIL